MGILKASELPTPLRVLRPPALQPRCSVKSFLFLSYSLPSQDQVHVLISSHGYKIPVVCFLHITCSYPHMALAFSHVLAHCAAMQWSRSGNLFGLTLNQHRKKKKKKGCIQPDQLPDPAHHIGAPMPVQESGDSTGASWWPDAFSK